MRSRITSLCLGVSFTFLLGGCAVVGSALNPYEDEFTCAKKAPFGKCETTLEVYSEIVSGHKQVDTVQRGPGALPPGYEIVQSRPLDTLPTYSVGIGATPREALLQVVKTAPLESGPTFPDWRVDAGDGAVYPTYTEKKAEQAAPLPLPVFTVRPNSETAYRDASLAKAAKLLKEPVTPMVIPPSVMRILILPRKGEDGELNMAQFSFVMVDKPRWAMGDYLSAMPED